MISDEEIPDLEGFDIAQNIDIPDEDQLAIDLLQREIEAAELNQIRAAVPIYKPLYARRTTLIDQKLKPYDFWSRVFGNCSPDLQNSMLNIDSNILGILLRSFHVERISVDEKGEKGDPRDLKFVFEFARDDADENEWFAGGEEPLRLEKKFYWRKQIIKRCGMRQKWEGLVSEPVRISWKEGCDPTNGLLDAACDLFEAEKKAAKESGKRITGVERTALSEYEHLVQELEKTKSEVTGAEDGTADDDESEQVRFSFFNWFGYRGRDITAEESEAATKEDEERWAKLAKGETVDEELEHKHGDDDDDEHDDEDDQGDEGMDDAEISPNGEEIAMELADDLWPKALSYFNESFEEGEDEDDLSAMLRAVQGGDSGEDEDEDDDDDEEEIEGVEDQPPKKKAKKTA